MFPKSHVVLERKNDVQSKRMITCSDNKKLTRIKKANSNNKETVVSGNSREFDLG